MEATLSPRHATDSKRACKSARLEISEQWSRRMVELWGMAPPRGAPQELLSSPGACFTAQSEASCRKDGLNRRIRNRTSGGVGGRGESYGSPSYPIKVQCSSFKRGSKLTRPNQPSNNNL